MGDCASLGIATYADTLEEVMEELEELIRNTLEMYQENNTLISMLKKNGISIHHDELQPDLDIQRTYNLPVEFEVPVRANI